MSAGFVFGVVLLAAAVVVLVLWRAPEAGRIEALSSRRVRRAVPLTVLGLGAVLVVLNCFTIVGTRDIGIVTNFGAPTRHLDNGLSVKAPWEKVRQLDGAIQTDSYAGTRGCTDIRIGNESTACVDNSIRWRINPTAADDLFRDYHSMDNIRDSLVTRELRAALNEVLANYNPLDQISADTSDSAAANLNTFGKQVTEDLQSQIGDQIEVKNVIIPIIRFDDSTQTKLNAYQAEVANTRIATQREQTALAQAQANNDLSASVDNNPNVLTSHCFDILEEMVKADEPVPAAFTCWPGSTNAVVVPATK